MLAAINSTVVVTTTISWVRRGNGSRAVLEDSTDQRWPRRRFVDGLRHCERRARTTYPVPMSVLANGRCATRNGAAMTAHVERGRPRVRLEVTPARRGQLFGRRVRRAPAGQHVAALLQHRAEPDAVAAQLAPPENRPARGVRTARPSRSGDSGRRARRSARTARREPEHSGESNRRARGIRAIARARRRRRRCARAPRTRTRGRSRDDRRVVERGDDATAPDRRKP